MTHDNDPFVRDSLDLVPAPTWGERPGWTDVTRRAADRRRPRLTAAPRLAVAAVAAVGLVAAGVAVTVGTGGGPGFVERAAAAMAPQDGRILHMRMHSAGPGMASQDAEIWFRDNRHFRLRMQSGPTMFEQDGNNDMFRAADNTIMHGRGTAGLCPGGPIPADPSECGEPGEGLRAAVEDGRAQVGDATTVGGRAVRPITYRIDGRLDLEPESPPRPAEPGPSGTLTSLRPGAVTVYADVETYAPVRIVDPSGTVTDVSTFEWLPGTEENEKLLSLRALHPDAAVEAVGGSAQVDPAGPAIP